MGKYHGTAEILELMSNLEQLRNVALVGHIDHGKTTLSDSLLAEAGLLSESLAGEARALDYLEEEQRRGITMKSANVSLYYEDSLKNESPFVINLVDTPGHLDFSGKVTRALRLVDGVVVIVDAVEEINSQSETVLRQAIQEGVKPILFINKIDRLFRELKLSNSEIENKLNRIVNKFNSLISRFADFDNEKKWAVSARDGSVLFGSALHRWGFTLEKLISLKWSFKDIYQKYNDDEFDELPKIMPVWEAVLSMVIKHIPNPKTAQAYRIHKIWAGDTKSKVGQSMINCDSEGPLVMCLSNIKYDSHGLIATGRIFSGTLKKGQKIFLIDAENTERVQKVALYMGARMDNADSIPAGNIAAITGLKTARSGETIVQDKLKDPVVSFENVKYVSDPVVTVSIEPEMLKDLNVLHEYLDQILIEDPNLQYNVSNETGEVLLSGMGPLHLEIAGKDIAKKGLNVTVSKPMSVFRESVSGLSKEITITSEDGINVISLRIERNNLKTVNFLKKLKLSAFQSFGKIMKSMKQQTDLRDDEVDGFMFSDQYGNLVINAVEGFEVEKYKGRKSAIQKRKDKRSAKGKKKADHTLYIKETTAQDMFDSLKSIFLSGPLVSERLAELKITIENLQLEEFEEGNFSDITPLFRNAIFKAIEDAGSVLLEPIYRIVIQIPTTQLGAVTTLLAQHQANINNVEQFDYYTEITAEISVREYIDFAEEIRSVSSGKAFWQAQFYSFEEVPENKRETIVQEIRFRKGMFF